MILTASVLDAFCRDSNKPALKLISEHDWSVFLVGWLRERGWLVHYERQSGYKATDGSWRGSGPRGKPDLTLAKDGRVLLIELKKENGRTSPDQDEWLAAAGDNARLWRPRDWPDIQREFH